MPTASITLPSGATVVIEGTQAEVADLIAKVQGNAPANVGRSGERLPRASNRRVGPLDLLVELIEGDFFKTPQDLSAVRIALEARGHFYPTTTLSPLMLRLVRRKELRRITSNKRWAYVR